MAYNQENLQAKENKPNIILILADDLGFETIGCYGNASYQTPRIDNLAEKGVKFNHCYAQPLCTPSRVKFMTGKYNFRNYEQFGYLNTNETTFAHLLKADGYATCIAGKWQLKGDEFAPFKAGFDEYLLWQITFTSYNERYKNPRVLENGKMKKFNNGEYGPRMFADFIMDFMERKKDEPFLVYYPMVLAHRPFVPSPDSKNYDSFKIANSGGSKDAITDTTYFKDEVAYMDKLIGELVDKTKELGISDNTLILFTGDNGTGKEVVSKMKDGNKIKGMKGATCKYGRHVPLVAYWDGKIEEGQVNDNLIDFSDFLPTLCDVAGVELPNGFMTDGYSFYPQMKNEDYKARDWVFSHFDCGKEKYPKRRMVHNKEWKLYENGDIFHISEDPLEENVLSLDDLNGNEKKLISTFKEVLSQLKSDQ
ncbi:arylsulfatase A [Marinifilum sp. JC070]|uniref:Arylsulfatase A n=2 Tax=Marinifilum caeruleilacunae TaxID=2499076 RepID=A0ABX1WYU5_9BACT|nr:arylsulfatase A [Marinifilum caeruleilacunae]